MLVFVLLNSLFLYCQCDSNTVQASFGEAFSTRSIELEGVVTGGKSIFTDLTADCFLTSPLKESSKNFKVYTDHEEFVHEIALGVGLTAKELGGKADIKTKYLKKSSTSTAGTLIEATFLRRRSMISKECLEEKTLDPDMLHDLKSLNYPLKKPHTRGHWLNYDAFISKWGSHILKSTDYGAKAVYHSSITTKSVTDKKELTLKLCSKFPELNLDGCVDAGPKTSTTKDSKDETNEVFVVGGSIEIRNQLQAGAFSQPLLDTLSAEAKDHQAPVKNEWFRLPELLVNRLMFEEDTDLRVRSIALMSYYEGYHVFGCDNHVVNDNNITVFVNRGDDEYPDFKCLQVTPGCQEHSDCKNWPVNYLGPCYCAGHTCLTTKTQGAMRMKSAELKVNLFPVGGITDLLNSGCHYSPSTGGCRCDNAPYELLEVWPLLEVLEIQPRAPMKKVRWGLVVGVGVLAGLVLGIIVYLTKSRGSKDKDVKKE